MRPFLEYCSPIWSPRLQKDIHCIEKVQRRFTKRLIGMKNIKYIERLRILGLERLDVRRLKADLILAYKIMFGQINIRPENYFSFGKLSATRGHNYKLFVPRCRSTTRQHFFPVRVAPVWNALPSCVDFSSLPRFKSSLQNVDLAKFCRDFQ